MNTNYYGRLALTEAARYFTTKGYIVSYPMNDNQFYDLVIEKDGVFTPVQCKYTSQKCNNNPDAYDCKLVTTGGSRSKIYSRVTDHDQLLFCMREDGICYVIPTKDITCTSKIRLITVKKGFSSSLDTSKYIVCKRTIA